MIDENVAKQIVHLRWLSQRVNYYRAQRFTLGRLIRCDILASGIEVQWRSQVGAEVSTYPDFA
jgi:hypothetical protein